MQNCLILHLDIQKHARFIKRIPDRTYDYKNSLSLAVASSLRLAFRHIKTKTLGFNLVQTAPRSLARGGPK